MELKHLLSEFSLSDLTSILLTVFSHKTDKMKPADVLKRYETNAYVKASGSCPITMNELSHAFLKDAVEAHVEPVLLSPVAPLGGCAAVAPVSQNKILSCLRGVEVLADATNVMALEIALRIGKKGQKHPVDLCAVHQLIRVQTLKSDYLPYFTAFCRVTSGRDCGSYRFEGEALLRHIGFYKTFFKKHFAKEVAVAVCPRTKGYKDNEGFISCILALLKEELPETAIRLQQSDQDNSYYSGLQFNLFVELHGREMPVIDGGFVDWTQQLLEDKKERLLISGIGLDLILDLWAERSGKEEL